MWYWKYCYNCQRIVTSAIKVTGIDFTPELLVQAIQQASIADVEDIECKEANVENLTI